MNSYNLTPRGAKVELAMCQVRCSMDKFGPRRKFWLKLVQFVDLLWHIKIHRMILWSAENIYGNNPWLKKVLQHMGRWYSRCNVIPRLFLKLWYFIIKMIIICKTLPKMTNIFGKIQLTVKLQKQNDKKDTLQF